MNHQRITFTLCLVEILALIGIATFPALLPTFIGAWQLSNTEAGWITAVYYAGYMFSVPVLVSVTDRLDARRVVLLGALGGMIAPAKILVGCSTVGLSGKEGPVLKVTLRYGLMITGIIGLITILASFII